MQSIIDAIVDFFSFIISKPYQLLLDILDWIKELVTQVLPSVVYQLLPDGVAEYLQTLDLDSVQNIIGPVAWFFPFWAILGIYATAYALAAGVRLTRFLIGFIPTIEG